jgi:hypothetical protein
MEQYEALAIFKSNVWTKWTDEQIFLFQVREPKLCVKFSAFHKATEKMLGRPVWTHEFTNAKRLYEEYVSKVSGDVLVDALSRTPTTDEILATLDVGGML